MIKLLERILAVLKADTTISGLIPSGNIRPADDITNALQGNYIVYRITSNPKVKSKLEGDIELEVASTKNGKEALEVINRAILILTPAILTGNRTYGIIVARFQNTNIKPPFIDDKARSVVQATFSFKGV